MNGVDIIDHNLSIGGVDHRVMNEDGDQSSISIEDGENRTFSVDDNTTVYSMRSNPMHTGNRRDSSESQKREKQLAAKEIRTVRRIKCFVITCLVFITVVVAVGAYYTSAAREQDEFEKQFKEDANKIIETIGKNLVLTLSASDAFTVSITSLAAATNQSWPYVVVPDFAVRAEKIRSLANAVYVNTYLLVTSDEREEWETFTSITGPSQIEESIDAIANYDKVDYWPIVTNYTLCNVIHDYDELELPPDEQCVHGTNQSGPYLPMWQTQPVIAYEPPYNWDLMSLPPTSTQNGTTSHGRVFDTRKAVITEAYLISDPNDTERLEEDQDEADWISSYISPNDTAMEPISDIYYPIILDANKEIEVDVDNVGAGPLAISAIDDDEYSFLDAGGYSTDSNNNSKKVVGMFAVAIYWRDTIRNILPDGSRGLIAVFENPCNPTFTYEINGPDVEFLGAGDLHEPKYNHLGVSANIDDFTDHAMNESAYSGVPLDTEFCSFTINIYPSEITEDHHTTLTPVYFSLITVVVFAVTALTFMTYDYWVERRQKVVMKTAVRTTKLVSSLFPDQVMDQMMDDDHLNGNSTLNGGDSNSNELNSGAFSVCNSEPKRLRSFLNDGSHDDNIMNNEVNRDGSMNTSGGLNATRHTTNGTENDNGVQLRRGRRTNSNYSATKRKRPKPIADLFPDTTVFFADIAGFTAWSSVREPASVFTLLETLYGAFDKVAKKYGIFKVETIGDSYVAVCGLPEPNANHAVAMSRFAFECLRVMKGKTLRDLELSLGPGTADLSLRIGLHSGPTIAGVLRGEKARFQLFGDTVNTAARMESNGIPNRIQVSQKTADLITNAGKGSWLTAREDLIDAKGKGQLQTYWLSRRRGGATNSTASVTVTNRTVTSASVASLDSADHIFSLSNDNVVPNTRIHSNTTAPAPVVRLRQNDCDDASVDVAFSDDDLDLPSSPSTTTKTTATKNVNGDGAPLVTTKASAAVTAAKSVSVESSIQRLIDWNVAIFQELLEEIVARRNANNANSNASPSSSSSRQQSFVDQKESIIVGATRKRKKHVRDEFVETIHMPCYNALSSTDASGDNSVDDVDDVKLDTKVMTELRDYITKIALFYNNENGFHNFHHASHVIMSTIKLLQRIATPDVKKKDCKTEQDYFNYTFGISHDPLTKFSIVFSALIHDVDHQGVSNNQLANEKDPMALAYDNKSILEQHSFDLAMSLLFESNFKHLRDCIYSTKEEYTRFRQLTINCVIATDIFDKDMKQFRESRWEKAFRNGKKKSNNYDNDNYKDVEVDIERPLASCHNNNEYDEEEVDDWNRKATITIEFIIQASDVAHTMQHWHVYQRWNKCLFIEMYTAYKNGRNGAGNKDPSKGWYEGELWFFDNYIIPLAKNLRECEVFGVSCDEFLDFATENRKEWSVKGRDIVEQMLNDVTATAPTKTSGSGGDGRSSSGDDGHTEQCKQTKKIGDSYDYDDNEEEVEEKKMDEKDSNSL